MSDEYIKKNDAIRVVNDMPYDTFFVEADRMWLIAEIDKLPSADVVERKRGEWIYQESCGSDRYDDYRCSNCGSLITVDAGKYDDIGFVIEDFRYCHNCGADMRGRDDERQITERIGCA